MVVISSIRLVNCQSHADTVYDLSPGLNVITGDNNFGKSVVFKIIKMASSPKMFDKKERGSLIQEGKPYALALFLFSDGSAGGIQILPDRYQCLYTESYPNIPFEVRPSPHPLFLEKMSVIIDPEESFIANVIDLDQMLLMVTSSVKTNNSLVEILISDSRLERLKEVLPDKVKFLKKEKEFLEDLILFLDEEQSKISYVDIDYLERKVEIMEASVHTLDKLVDLGREMKNLVQNRFITRDFDFLIWLIDFYEKIEVAIDSVNSLIEVKLESDVLEILEELITPFENLESVGVVHDVELYSILEKLVDGSLLSEDLVVVSRNEELIDLLETIDVLRSAYEQVGVLIDSTNSQRAQIEVITAIESEVSERGRRVPCVLYGEVQHVDEVCIPVNYRHSFQRR